MVTANAADPLRFHWSLSAVGDAKRRGQAQETMSGALDLATHTEFCRAAEACGIDSLLIAFGYTRPDPLTWSAALGSHTKKINFLTAVRSGTCSPTLFVQQVNTLSVITGGRVHINIVAGRAPAEQRYYGDFLTHDQRYARTDEFWQICHALWRDDGPVDFTGQHYQVEGARINTPFQSTERDRPKIYLGGNSEQAIGLAVRHADCLLTFPDTPGRLAQRIRPVLDAGKKVGLLVSMIAKPTRDEALAAAAELVSTAGDTARQVHHTVRDRTDSVGFSAMYQLAEHDSTWVTRYLWTGAVPYLGPPAISLVGSPTDLTEAILEYRDIGITEFLFTGFPDLPQMQFFAAEILPRVRDRERRSTASATG